MSLSVSAVTVTWNSAEEVSGLIGSLIAEGGVVSEIVVVDNASKDGTPSLVKESCPQARVLENRTNLGFAAAANQGIKASSSEAVLLVNPDVSFKPGFIRTLSDALDSGPGIGSAAPKLLRPGGRVLDSAGLVMNRTRKAADRGSDMVDGDQYDSPCRVFGACGAAALYRRAALEDAMVLGEYFDESFFAYKEDVDLAWRMNLLGWECAYEPRAVATHSRGWKVSSRMELPREIRKHSFKNHYLTILKNDDLVNMLAHLPWVIGYDTALFFYALFREPFLLGALKDVFRLMPNAAEKREYIMARRKVSPAQMRRLFG